jgi:hypothetical protein
MLIKPGEHAHLAQLLRFMDLGEQLAHDCAQTQCALAPERGMQTFLAGQARQEKYHAFAFQGAIRWLAPKFSQSLSISDHMNQYRQLVESAIVRQDFAETLLAEQIILEGLGEAILKKIEVGLVKRGAPFQRLRRMLIHQEEAHHQFGLRVLSKMIQREEESYDTLRKRSEIYLSLAKMMLFSAQDAFYSIDEDPQEYWDEFYGNLPTWLQTQPQPRIPSLSSEMAMV